MNKYVKNPIEITAIQYKHDGSQLSYMGEQNRLTFFADTLSNKLYFDRQNVSVNTNHGAVSLNNGDYLIKNNGEIYPCSDEVFQQNYKAAPSTFLDRLKVEQVEVQTRLDGLTKTLDVERKPDFISEDQWILMSRQQFHMRMYAQIIGQRIDLAEGKPIAPAATRKTYLQGSETDQT